MKAKTIQVFLFISLLTSCAASPPVRNELTTLPSLSKGSGRILIDAGKMNGIKLWSVHQVGPVFLNEKDIGSTAKNEYIAVDVNPGTYEAHCTQAEPVKNFIKKTNITIKAGQTKSFACDMSTYGSGGAFGILGALASDYLTQSFLIEREISEDSKLVSHKRLIN